MARRNRKKRTEAEAEAAAPDSFEIASATGLTWFEKNWWYLAIGAVAVFAGVLITDYVSSSSQRSASEMTAELNGLLDDYEEATDLEKVATSTVPEQVNAGYRSVQRGLAAFRDQYPGQPAAALAGLYEADLWRRLGEPKNAVPLYESYLSALGDDAPFAAIAHEGAGYAYEELEQLDNALRHFESMSKLDYARGYGLKHQGRVLEAKGDRDRAKQIYEELAGIEDAGMLKMFAEERLLVLE